MIRWTTTILLVLAGVLLAVRFLAPDILFSQARKSSASGADLLKSIGVEKMPAGSVAPAFTLRDLNGQNVSLSNYRGRVVFLNFWATWCGPCREEMPSMERLHRALGSRGLAVLAVNLREDAAEVARFMRKYQLSFPALLDSDGQVSSLYRVWALPMTYIIDGGGQIIGKKAGPKDWAARHVTDVFQTLIGETGEAAGPLVSGPEEPLPTKLRVKSQGSALHAQQDGRSEVLDKLRGGEDLSTLGKASGAGEFWYMVKTKAGTVGWIRGTDVEEVRQTK